RARSSRRRTVPERRAGRDAAECDTRGRPCSRDRESTDSSEHLLQARDVEDVGQLPRLDFEGPPAEGSDVVVAPARVGSFPVVARRIIYEPEHEELLDRPIEAAWAERRKAPREVLDVFRDAESMALPIDERQEDVHRDRRQR